MSAMKPYFEKKKLNLRFTYDDMLKNSVPELRNFKKNLLIPEWMQKKKLSCKQILNSLSYPNVIVL